MATAPAGRVRFLDHSVVPVVDLWRAERFYTAVLDGAIFQKVGMTYAAVSAARQGDSPGFVDPPGAFVKLGRQHLGLFVQDLTCVYPPSDLERAWPCWGISVASDDFDEVVGRVRDTGVPVAAEREEVYGPLRTRMVRCTDSEGNSLELAADPRGRFNGQSVTGLSHMHFETVDLRASADFYATFLGLEVVAEGPDWVALGLPSEQCLIFHEVEELSPATIGPYYGRHFAFTLDEDDFHAIVARLRAAGIQEGDALGRAIPGELDSYFFDTVNTRMDRLGYGRPVEGGIWLQIQNKDSLQAAAGKPRLRYAPA